LVRWVARMRPENHLITALAQRFLLKAFVFFIFICAMPPVIADSKKPVIDDSMPAVSTAVPKTSALTLTDNSGAPRLTPQLRWGRLDAKSQSAPLFDSLSKLFETHSEKINFAKRSLPSLLEQAQPRSWGRVFPFRQAHDIPKDFVFINFGRQGFLAAEVNPRVPPLLSGTQTLEWIELRSPTPVTAAREFRLTRPVTQGLRDLGLQNPWSTDIFSALWSTHFESAAAIVDAGGLRCLNAASAKKLYPQLGEPDAHARCTVSQPSVVKSALSPMGPQAQASPCLPMGSIQSQSLEFLGDEKSSHCLLWRNALDERFLQKELRSKLICLNARHKSYVQTRFSSIVAIIPASVPETVHIIESEDGLLSAYRFELTTLSAKKEEINVPVGQNVRNLGFPIRRTGLYACPSKLSATTTLNATSPAALPLTLPEGRRPMVDWVYVDESIYSGLRPTRSDVDAGWRIRESGDGNIGVEKLGWAQLQYEHPSIMHERQMSCVAARHIDAKCGLRVLQTALQLSQEWLKDDFDKNGVLPAVQLSAALLMAQSLEKVVNQLPEWSLRSETDTLLAVFKRQVKDLMNRTSAGQDVQIRLLSSGKVSMPAASFIDLPPDSPDFLAIKTQLSSSPDVWAALKQRSL